MNFRPRLLLLGLLALPGASPAAGPDLSSVERLILERTNQYRSSEGARRVAVDGRLARAARDFAMYMADTERYGHEADGRKPSQRVKVHGYRYCVVSENISYQYSSEDFGTAELASRYFEGWKKSPGHRRNMLEASVTDTAVAVARSARSGRYYAVQMFARPRSAGCA